MQLVSRHLRLAALTSIAAIAVLAPGSAQAQVTRTTQTETEVTGSTNNVGDVLTCVEGAYTSNVGPVTTSREWTRNGAPAGSGPYTLTPADFGVTIVCTETATDGTHSLATASVPIILTEPMPTIATLPSITGTVYAGRAASCDGAKFDGYNLGPITYTWFRSGEGGAQQVGAGQTYVPARADIGRGEISCQASVTNPTGTTESSSDYVPVEDGRPEMERAPKITGKATPGLTVACNPGTWRGEAPTFTYQWQLDGKPIKGATKRTLLLLDAYHDRSVRCRVTATNASGSTSFTSNQVSPFAPPILATLLKRQPAAPKLSVAAARGITSKLACNASCATQSTAFILTSKARSLGIVGRDLGGATIVGQATTRRTFKGELVVTTTFSRSAKAKLARLRSPIRIDLLFETSYGARYNDNKYHVATSRSVTLRP